MEASRRGLSADASLSVCTLLSKGVCYLALFWPRRCVILHSFVQGGCYLALCYPRGCDILHSFVQGGVVSCTPLSRGVCYPALFYSGGCLTLRFFIRGGVLSCALLFRGGCYHALCYPGVCVILHSFSQGGVILPILVEGGVISRVDTYVRSPFLDKVRRRNRVAAAGPKYRQRWA